MSNTSTCKPTPKSLMNLPKTTFCMSLQKQTKNIIILDEVCSTNPICIMNTVGACLRETFMTIFLAFQNLAIYSILFMQITLAGQWSITTVYSHLKKRIQKLFGNIRICFVSTEKQNFFQEIPSIWHWNKRPILMQPVRELVLLRWLTQYKHELGWIPFFKNNNHI